YPNTLRVPEIHKEFSYFQIRYSRTRLVSKTVIPRMQSTNGLVRRQNTLSSTASPDRRESFSTHLSHSFGYKNVSYCLSSCQKNYSDTNLRKLTKYNPASFIR